MYTLCFYVPESTLEDVKSAVFAAGAGRIGNYEQCCWQVEGQGQFRPLAGSDPAIGEQGELETVANPGSNWSARRTVSRRQSRP